MYKNVLVLIFNKTGENTFMGHMNLKTGLTVSIVLKDIPDLFRPLRKLHLLSGLPGIKIWFTDWYKNLKDYSTIICVATQYSIPVLKWIHNRVHHNCHLINYYWDEIHISKYPVVDDERFSNWSFDLQNCNEYNMKYNPQFWISALDLKEDNPLYEVSFVGGDRNGKYKDRDSMVSELYDYLTNLGCNIYFKYVSGNKALRHDIRIPKNMPLDKFLEIIRQSKVVLELVENDNQWMTQRVFYALGNEKKLITNNKFLISEKIYSPENIFILGYDNMKDLSAFIDSPFKKMNTEIIEYYDLDHWVNRFIED